VAGSRNGEQTLSKNIVFSSEKQGCQEGSARHCRRGAAAFGQSFFGGSVLMKKITVKNLVLSALFLAIAFLLPFLTGQIPTIGSMLLPMHLPVLLCGFVCGPVPALVVGAVAPILRSLVFGMPPMFPTAFAMAFEMAAYGLIAGLLYKKLPKKPVFVFVALFAAMLGGRVVLGLVNIALQGNAYTWELFMAGAFIKAWPGIILQVILVPAIVLALRKAKVLE
jgi:riboflavin transporter FmnP